MNPSPYVVVLGGLNADLQGTCYAPFRPADSNPGRASLSAGGVGRNIAENLVRLGCRVDLVSVLGDDALSAWLRRSCGSLGIGTDLCLVLPGTPASQYLCLLDSDGSLAGAVAAMDGMDALTAEALEARSKALQAADLIVADTNIPGESLEWTARRFPGKPLLLDPVSAAKAVRARSCAGSFTIVKPNRGEAEALTGVPCGTREGAARAAEALRASGAGRVFLSLGGEGLMFDGPDGRGIARPAAGPAVNVSGAGDAAAAALAWAWLRGCDTRRSAALAAAAAALTVSAPGTVSPRMDPGTLEKLSEGVRFEESL